MIAQFFSTIKGWLYAVLGVAGAVMYGLLRLRTNQRDNARTERDAAIDDAESATELANKQSELSRAQQQAREEAKDETVNRTRDDGMFGDSRLQHKD